MAYERRTWYQRLGQGLNKFLIGEKDAEGKQELTNAPDSITQQGDVISADNLNDLEGRIQAGFAELKLTKIWENPDTTVDFAETNLDFDDNFDDFAVLYFQTTASSATGKLEIFRAGTLTVYISFSFISSISISTYSRELWARHNPSSAPSVNTRIHFTDCKKFEYKDFGGQQTHTFTTANDCAIPVAVYKVGNIYS